ncbi:uncharacterized protein LOC111268646 [Varroa jacobsoni]|uniref:Uncharacterized protein n=1 Tax=Varroa destructor TaxID=109461 RepID=A0A7M7K2W9_VARDE|nr:uncharacterized protein LOC111249867 [Varroa destructor]XP_022703488.1 uncharacterized protein LOC111268646 [Varroa jacobsoni]
MRVGTIVLLVSVIALVCLANSADAAKKSESGKSGKGFENGQQGAVSKDRSMKRGVKASKYSKEANVKENIDKSGRNEKAAYYSKNQKVKGQKQTKVKKSKRVAEQSVSEEAIAVPEKCPECEPAPECPQCPVCQAAAEAVTATAAEIAEDGVVVEEACEATIEAGLFCDRSCSCVQGTVCFAAAADASHGICKVPESEDLNMGVYLS